MKKSIGAKTLVFPTPVWCIGTYDKDGKPNMMTVAWGGICCSKPPCVSISLRKATYTYACLLDRKAFTVNVPSEKYVTETDYVGIVSAKTVDKFEKTGLTPVKSEVVDAPYVKEFPMILECKLIHHYEIGLHTYFVGEILDVKADENVLNEKGLPEMTKVKPIIYGPEINSYYGVGGRIGDGFSIGKKLF